MFASNHQQIFRSSSANNENVAILPTMSGDAGTVSKTPAAPGKQRRVLGDISNRTGGGGLGNNNNNNDIVPKKAQTPASHLKPRMPLSSTRKQVKATTTTPGLSKRPELAILPRNTQTKAASSYNNENKNRTKSTKAKSIVTFEEPIDDIEKPAGRLWNDQPEYDDDTSLSLPGAATMQEDWVDLCRARYSYSLKLQDEANARADSALEEVVAKQLQEDEKAILGADIWIERTLSFDDDLDDELSWGAPSFCGEISF